MPTLREIYSTFKKQVFLLLSNNHIYACKIQLEEYYNKLENSITLIKVEKFMLQ